MAVTAAVSGFQDGTGPAARFNNPSGIAVLNDGRLVVADTLNHALRAMTPAGEATTLAGAPRAGGAENGTGSAARFSLPAAIAAAPDGSFAIADEGNHLLRRMSSLAEVTFLAGTPGTAGLVNGPAAAAQFNAPAGICYAPDGTLYVGDKGNRLHRRIDPAGAVVTLAGTFALAPGAAGAAAYAERPLDASGITVAPGGGIFVTDANLLRQIPALERFAPVAGVKRLVSYFPPNTYVIIWSATVRANNGDGTGTEAVIGRGKSPVSDPQGNLYFSDAGHDTIRRCTPDGTVTTLAGPANQRGYADGPAAAARFSSPRGLVRAGDGSFYIADSGNHVIRRLSPSGLVTTIGGLPGYSGSGEGTGALAQFAGTAGLTFDAEGNLLVADRENHRIVRGTQAGAPHLVREFQQRLLAAAPTQESIGSSPPGVNSGPLIFRLHNTGNRPLRIDSASLESIQSAVFCLTIPGFPITILPDTPEILTVDYFTAALGPLGAVLVPATNEPAGQGQRFHLTGTGNTLPVFAGYSISVAPGQNVRIPPAKILARISDADGHAVSLDFPIITTESGVVVQVLESDLYYRAQSGLSRAQTIHFTITDALGGRIPGAIAVNLVPQPGGSDPGSNNPPLLDRLPDGRMTITFHGVPGRSYQIQRSAGLMKWIPLITLPAGDNGVLSWTDPAPPEGSAYYRLALPP